MPESFLPKTMIHRREETPALWMLHLQLGPIGDGHAVPLDQWSELSAEQQATTGLVLQGHDALETLDVDVSVAPVIALHFPKFADGRCYSHAYWLRRHLGYTRPIVAFGDVLRDQLPYMERSGIRTFYLRQDQNTAGCIEQLRHFTKHYQYNDAFQQLGA